MTITVVEGDLLEQPVEVIVNPWNRNIIPWWLLLPQGVSGAIKRKAGTAPFREVARYGAMPLGSARLTGPGRLPFRAIIHVAGINLLWRASERSIRDSVVNAMALVRQHGFTSVAFPLIGAHSGGFSPQRSQQLICEELGRLQDPVDARIVVFRPGQSSQTTPRPGQ